MTRSLCSWALLFALFALTGCGGPKPVTVTGTVVKDGKPIEVSKTGSVQITLVPDVAKGEHHTTRVGQAGPDGKFEITDVPPGKYKVAVQANDTGPVDDKLKGAFSPENTKIVREIDGKTPLLIDLAKP
jgi:hypothetical protein